MRLGIDLISIQRIKNFVDRFEDKALKRFLTSNERAAFKHNIQKLASAWAAKEAFSKALGTGIGENCSFLDLELSHNKKGSPFLIVHPKLIQAFNITEHTLSITHDQGLVIAVVAVIYNQNIQ